MKERIIGIDMARALAVFGMIIVNFKLVVGQEGGDLAKSIAGALEGKAAATFVVLAGVGLALLSKSALQSGNLQKLKVARMRIIKRAIFLFIVGLSYISIWPADILHFYGIYMLFVLVVLQSNARWSFIAAILIVLLYPVLMMFVDYERGWNFDTLEYLDLWSLEGFIRNLFYNGFHPVIPWASFMLIGYWYGRQSIHDKSFVSKSLYLSLSIFLATQLSSYGIIQLLSAGNEAAKTELTIIFGSSPMPPLPIYMISGTSLAISVIAACILIGFSLPSNLFVRWLNQTGQLALTFYVAHVIIGMGGIEAFGTKSLGTYSMEFSLGYALAFSFSCIAFAVIWKKYKSMGPLEWVMRKLTD